ncbi:class I SAM-dependent methyltransferase [Streptomyces johnsoniae]|uniref:Class I SAM-dependent methyltransferase n=1 Tax=Streptomyces johnsoniae TaxID=3075532 RepID=A0ABU2SBN5_9ACTN|nr:class I SAM-dependent methyltransferase [Streptomyces sp. DSM 41886]MDT0446394.1 class I SAM-dependent methyltransferase [Streptomyces sp. DSM 41886]
MSKPSCRPFPLDDEFDAVVSTGALVHLPNDTTLLRTFESVHRVLRPGGTFTFDMYTERHAESWVAHTTPTARVIESGPFTLLMSITRTAIKGTYNWHGLMFLRDDTTQAYVRRSETHQLYAWAQEQIVGLGARAGFGDIEVFDNFTRQPTGSQTVCETYVMVKP